MHYWSVWYPQAASTGLLLARGQLDPTDALLVHAAPPLLTVEVFDDDRRIASGERLAATGDSPMCLLRRSGSQITRTDLWPTIEHQGLPVLLPGGEVGILKQWWNADDHGAWRWQVEFFNQK